MTDVTPDTALSIIDAVKSSQWKIILGAFLGSGVATAVATWILNNLSTSKQREIKGQFLSNTLAVSFERYAILLANALNDDEQYSRTYETPQPEQGRPLMRVPTPPNISPDSSYEVLEPTLRDRVLQFEDDIAVANFSLTSASEVLDGEDVNEIAIRASKEMGKKALVIAKDLRRNYELSERNLTFAEWNIEAEFE